jgi:hypothetical protein
MVEFAMISINAFPDVAGKRLSVFSRLVRRWDSARRCGISGVDRVGRPA